jgi:hypothetical protein
MVCLAPRQHRLAMGVGSHGNEALQDALLVE